MNMFENLVFGRWVIGWEAFGQASESATGGWMGRRKMVGWVGGGQAGKLVVGGPMGGWAVIGGWVGPTWLLPACVCFN